MFEPFITHYFTPLVMSSNNPFYQRYILLLRYKI
jgi:hypothetical protein